jgi:hypothetical protein
MEGARKMLPDISELREEIMSIHISDSDWRDRLVKWKGDLETSQVQVNEWFRRQALLIQATEPSLRRWPRLVVLFSHHP